MLVLLLNLACRTAATSSSPVADVWKDHTQVVLGDGSACTIVAIHGYGASPENFQRIFQGMPLNAVVVLPRGPLATGEGTAWFPSSRGSTLEKMHQAVDGAARRLAAGIQHGVPGDRSKKAPLITGFSQGGMLSWRVATTSPGAVRAALPVGGLLVPPYPTTPPGPPIEAFHGDADKVVPFAPDEESAKAMKAQGWDVTFHSYEGVSHTISPAMHRDLTAALQKHCR